jgi:hypothetical protein
VLVIAVEGGVGVAAETKDGINTATNAAATIRDINSFFISLLNSFLNFSFLVRRSARGNIIVYFLIAHLLDYLLPLSIFFLDRPSGWIIYHGS